MDTGTVGESSQMEGGRADAGEGRSALPAAMLVQPATKETTGSMSHAATVGRQMGLKAQNRWVAQRLLLSICALSARAGQTRGSGP